MESIQDFGQKYIEFKKKYKKEKIKYPGKEWNLVFKQIETTKDDKKTVRVHQFYPVFIWNNEKKNEIRYSKETRETYCIGKGEKIVIHPVTEGSYMLWEFEITNNHELWKQLQNQHGGDLTAPGTKRPPLVAQNRKLHRGNGDYASLLERIDENGDVDMRIILRDGRGICTFRDGTHENLAVVDGNHIHVFDKNLEYLGSICRIQDSPRGISFTRTSNDFFVSNETHYSTVNLQNSLEVKLKSGTRIGRQKAIHFHNLHYILLRNGFVCNLGSMEDPMFIMLYYDNDDFPNADFSDFIIGDTYALIADYGRNQIIEYCINDEKQDNNFIKFGKPRNDREDNLFKNFSEFKYCGPKESQLKKIQTVKNIYFGCTTKIEEIHKPQGICSQGEHVFFSSKNCINSIYRGGGDGYWNIRKITLSRIPEKITVLDDKIFAITSFNFGNTDEKTESDKNKKIPIYEGPADNDLKDYISTVQFNENTSSNNKNINNNTPTSSNDANRDNEFVACLKYLFSSVVFTSHVLKHLDSERREFENKLQLLTKWVIKISSGRKNGSVTCEHIWSRISYIYRLFINFKYNYQSPNAENHISMNLQSHIASIKKEESLGSIVFINSEFTYSYEKPNQPFAMGIICEESENTIDVDPQRIDQTQTSPICIFGSTLVQVFIPKYQKTDERGMFVIIKENNDVGVGEIISFADLHLENRNSYHIVGCCILDEFSNLILYSCRDKKPISFPIDIFTNETICLVSMVTFPMKKQFLNDFFPCFRIEFSLFWSFDLRSSLQSIINAVITIFSDPTIIYDL